MAHHGIADAMVRDLGAKALVLVCGEPGVSHGLAIDIMSRMASAHRERVIGKAWKAAMTAATMDHAPRLTSLLGLFDMDADVRVPPGQPGAGSTCMLIAATMGHTATVAALLQAGADPNAVTGDSTPLMRACNGGQFGVVEALLAHPRTNIGATAMPGGLTALHLAAKAGDDKMVRCLLDAAGVDVNVEGSPIRGGRLVAMAHGTPLHWAIRCRSAAKAKEVVKELISAPDVDLELLNGMGETAVLQAAITGRRKLVKALVTAGANLAAADSDGGTMAHHAAYNGDECLIKLLAELGAPLSKCDHAGRQPLDVAIMCGHMGAARLLA